MGGAGGGWEGVAVAILRGFALMAALGGLGAGGGGAVEVGRPGLHGVELVAGEGRAGGVLFEELDAARTGLDFSYHWNPAPQYERLLNSSAVGAGVCVGDYDGDGRPDLCLTRPLGGCALYRNLGHCRFTNVTEQAGLRTAGAWTTGATFADVNGDGRLDLHVCCYAAANRLYVNQGDGTFVEQARALGLDFNGASMAMAFADYDRDGRLDAYLLTGGLIPGPAQRFRVKFVDGRPVVPEELQEYWQLIYQPGERAAAAEAGQVDRLYHNRGDGTFVEVGRAAGIAGFDFGNAAVWWDYNGDGWPDLYVANDYFGPDRLYRNNRDGTFSDVAREVLPRTPWTSMGADVADLDNDGRLDLMASDMSGTTHRKRMVEMGDVEKSGWFLDLPEPRQYMWNAVYLNAGVGRFFEAARLMGVADTDWTWSTLLEDMDDDGWVDLFVANGMTRDWMDNDLALASRNLAPVAMAEFWRRQPVRADRNLAFRNRGDLRFESVAARWGLDHAGPSFGAALADLDGDGRLDLVVNDFEAPVRLYRNCGQDGHRVKIRLEGRVNRWGIGATVRIETAAGAQMRYLTLTHGFMSAGEPVVHFGLGAADRIRRLTVEWPGGKKQVFEDLDVDRHYTVIEPAEAAAVVEKMPVGPALFSPTTILEGVRHEAEPGEDLRRLPLLPWDLSHFGPGLAWADIDGDGFEEFYLPGRAGHPGGIYRRTGTGPFGIDLGSGVGSREGETAGLFFDANGDGAVDLLVVAGGDMGAPNDARYGLRLYLNDGRGHFGAAAPGALPDIAVSGGALAAADFDRDGDLDVFVGGRQVPGRYAVAPASSLLRNEGGRFLNVGDQVAPGLRGAGLVSGALWSDTDDDGWPDLLLTCEWGLVRLFRNDQGRLVEKTAAAGLAGRLGFWTGIAAGDFNGDGAMDYVVGNFGLNTRYQPSREEPCQLYFGEFAGNGEWQHLEALATPAGLLPVRGKSMVEKVMPRLAESYPTHARFAEATLTEMLGAEALAGMGKVEVNCLESGVLINNRKGGFEFRALPRLAQVAPAFGVAVTEVDGDGNPDVYLAQNFYDVRRETGRLNGGMSLLMLGRGDGSFMPVAPERSGLVVPDNARSLAVTDLNGDGWPDFVVGVNGGPVRGFERRQPVGGNRCFLVHLVGKEANRAAVGARVTVGLKNRVRRVAEVCAGSGYLSQSTTVLAFGLGAADEAVKVGVRWPGGTRTEQAVPAGAGAVRIRFE
jgi:hypothetical protein